jgi:hypothetical protein
MNLCTERAADGVLKRSFQFMALRFGHCHVERRDMLGEYYCNDVAIAGNNNAVFTAPQQLSSLRF